MLNRARAFYHRANRSVVYLNARRLAPSQQSWTFSSLRKFQNSQSSSEKSFQFSFFSSEIMQLPLFWTFLPVSCGFCSPCVSLAVCNQRCRSRIVYKSMSYWICIKLYQVDHLRISSEFSHLRLIFDSIYSIPQQIPRILSVIFVNLALWNQKSRLSSFPERPREIQPKSAPSSRCSSKELMCQWSALTVIRCSQLAYL